MKKITLITLLFALLIFVPGVLADGGEMAAANVLASNGRTAEAIVARNYALTHGVPENAILVETDSQITWENLQNAQCVAGEQGITSFLIVSDPLHMKRALLMTEDLGMTAYASPTPTTRYQTPRTQIGFLAREVWFLGLHLLYRPYYLWYESPMKE